MTADIFDLKDDLPFATNGTPTPVKLDKETVIAMYTEPCPKCRGTGAFYGYSGRIVGQCFECKGAGKKSYKTSPEERAKGREAAARAKQKKLDDIAKAAHEWKKEHPAEWAWMESEAARFEFAGCMVNALRDYGYLTERQFATVERLTKQSAERKAKWAAERAAAEAAAPSVNADRLEQAFRTAKANGLKWPAITLGEMKVKPAGENSKNPGALYVVAGEAYLGKIIGGRFIKSRDCLPEQESQIVELVNDPKAAAEAYGKRTGICCCCGRELTNEGSIDAGIGPICAQRFGW